MNIEEYISSGIIELYVLGATTPEESVEVERMAAEYPEVRSEIIANQHSMESFANLHKVDPRPEMKSKVLNAIRQEKSRSFEIAANATRTAAPVRSLTTWKWMAAAATVLLIISLSINAVYIHKYNDTNDRYTTLLASQQQLMVNNHTIQARMERAENDLQLLTNPAVKPVNLDGVAAHPDMKAMVYYNVQNKKAYLGNSNLPKPPAGKEYQLWAIIDGKPVDMGMYDPSQSTGITEMKTATAGNIQAFGVTLEKAGGVASPTMDQMYVLGKI